MKQKHPWQALWLAGTVLAVAGCGSTEGDAGDEGRDGGSESGTVAEPWTGYCTGTFTEDTPITDVFGDTRLTARAGEEFLMSDFDDSFGARADFVFLGSGGPDSFEVEPKGDGSWPFTSNCALGEGVPYYAVFEDVGVYAEEGLTTKLCDLSRGTVLPNEAGGTGYSLVANVDDGAIYNVLLGPFSEQCGGATDGYVNVPQTQSLGTTTWLVPIIGIIGPA